jgi:hypothetical protein
MNVQAIPSTPAQDDRTAIQPIAAMGDFAPAHIPSEQQAFPLSLRDGSMPQLTGEIRSLVYIRLREVSLLVTVGWSFVLLLCLSGLDGLFNPARLGIGCIPAMMFTTAVFLVCGIMLRVGARYSLAWLRGFEAVFLWGSVVCAAWLRYATVGHALDQATPDRFMVLYGSTFSNLIWMAVLVIYGIFAPNTWRRLLMMLAGVIAVLVGVEVAHLDRSTGRRSWHIHLEPANHHHDSVLGGRHGRVRVVQAQCRPRRGRQRSTAATGIGRIPAEAPPWSWSDG